MDWLWVVVGFISGSLPLAVWVGKYGFNKDIRQYGDGNPGSFNVIRSGGIAWGGLALMLEITKGALPVGLAVQVFGISGAPLVAAAIAPPLGHAFSPWLRFNGGKAVASVFGVWIGLTLWQIPLIGMLTLTILALILTVSGWAVMLMMVVILIYLLLTAAPFTWLAVWLGHLLIFGWKHRTELNHLPHLKLPFFLSHLYR
jgi:glycerol-3-phosphate acyltransferase PlsY